MPRTSVQSKRPHPFFRILTTTWSEFNNSKCSLYASALTFYSIFAIVPIIALSIGMARGFGYESILEEHLKARFAQHQEILGWLLDFAHSLLGQVKNGILTGIGVCLLFWTATRVLSSIESVFNAIWKVSQQRNWLQKSSNYLAVIFIAPFLFILSSSVALLLASDIHQYIAYFISNEAILQVVRTLLGWSSLIFVWLLLTFMYVFMPNTKVSFKASMLAGAISGVVFVFLQWAYIKFQIGVASYGAIYGSFAALPLFFIWTHTSWLVILGGAQLSYAIQNVKLYEYDVNLNDLSSTTLKTLALYITYGCIKKYACEDERSSARDISESLHLPLGITEPVLDKLVSAGILHKVLHKEEIFYSPAKPTETLSIQRVLELWLQEGSEIEKLVLTPELIKIRKCLEDFREVCHQSPSNHLLKDL